MSKPLPRVIAISAVAVMVLGEPLTWRHGGAFLCLVGAVAFRFVGE